MGKERRTEDYIISDTAATRGRRWRAETPWPAPDLTGTGVSPAAMVRFKFIKDYRWYSRNGKTYI